MALNRIHTSVCMLRFQYAEARRLRSAQTISIVDDDEGTRLATASLVRSLGWRARVFASAEEFLRSDHIGETSCLISDIRMPGTSGIEMHDRLLALGYVLPTIFVTAFPTASLDATVRARGALAILEKPVDAVAIEQLLNLALGQP
jgi:FixJ family two-component response regulator